MRPSTLLLLLCCSLGALALQAAPSRATLYVEVAAGDNSQFFSNVQGKLSFPNIFAALDYVATVDDDAVIILYPERELSYAPPFGKVENSTDRCVLAVNSTVPTSPEGYVLSGDPVVLNVTGDSGRSPLRSTIIESKCPYTERSGFNISLPVQPAPNPCTFFQVGLGNWTLRNIFMDGSACVLSPRNTRAYYEAVHVESRPNSTLSLELVDALLAGPLFRTRPPPFAPNGSQWEHGGITAQYCLLQWDFARGAVPTLAHVQAAMAQLSVTSMAVLNSTRMALNSTSINRDYLDFTKMIPSNLLIDVFNLTRGTQHVPSPLVATPFFGQATIHLVEVLPFQGTLYTENDVCRGLPGTSGGGSSASDGTIRWVVIGALGFVGILCIFVVWHCRKVAHHTARPHHGNPHHQVKPRGTAAAHTDTLSKVLRKHGLPAGKQMAIVKSFKRQHERSKG